MFANMKIGIGLFFGGMCGWAAWEILSYWDRHH
jgi:hypothetical protein